MTSTQIIVLVLLVAAFGAGWVARGAGRGEDTGFLESLHAALATLELAQDACDDALRRGTAAALDDVATQVRTARHDLAEWVGAESPLVEDMEAARDAITLVTSAVRDGAPQAAAPFASVVRDARVRFGRATRTIELLPE